ncbi:MAG: tetratricopeptide repeat protein [Acidobacteriota bacterium]
MTRLSTTSRRFRCRMFTALLLGFLALLTAACGGGYQEPATQPAQLAFGVDMAERGLWNEALFRFEQARRIAPGDARVLNNIAVAYEALGQFDEALAAYREALRVDRSNQNVRQNYSRFVEFYRAFKPDEEGQADAGDTP